MADCVEFSGSVKGIMMLSWWENGEDRTQTGNMIDVLCVVDRLDRSS